MLLLAVDQRCSRKTRELRSAKFLSLELLRPAVNPEQVDLSFKGPTFFRSSQELILLHCNLFPAHPI